MKKLVGVCFLFMLCATVSFGQAWSTFIDPSRAIDWTSAGFSIPSYTTNCSTQPTLTASSMSAASANASAIQTALNSCNSTHNVVNIGSGTFYVAGIDFGTQGQQVLRGAGPNSTELIFTGGNGCAGGLSEGFCMRDGTGFYNGSSETQPGGSNACNWTAGYAQGTTSLTLSSCGGAPPVNSTIILDQANDTSDTAGVYICDVNSNNCGYESNTGGNNNGRSISGTTHSEQQVAFVTGVASLGGGSYTVTIASPGVYFTNIRSGQAPGAWWPGFVQNDGLENMTIDGSVLDSTIGMYDCYQCWVQNVRAKSSGRNAVDLYQSGDDVIQNNYFYAAQGSASESYSIEFDAASQSAVINNIFQQVTTPIMFGAGTGNVILYNFNIDVNYSCGGGCPAYSNGAYASHNAGNQMNLFEGNNFFGVWGDDAWGSAGQTTIFRNMMQAWQNGKTASTFPIMLRAFNRAENIVGNVMGQTGYHNQYQAIVTSTSGGTGQAQEDTSIYSIGWAGTGATCSSGFVSQCDLLTATLLMRWGNYDTVHAATQWTASEAAPPSATYLGANFSSSYFTSLAHTLPASLYYASTPGWWPSGKAWPPVGPDVTTGNIGVCASGTYAGFQATVSSQCSSGGLTTSWASHAVSIPAEDCYLSTMHGPPDGSGSVLSFDANTCYTGGGGPSLISTTTTLTAANSSPAAGTNDLLTATISPSSGPTGTVTFSDGGSSIGTGTVSAGVATHNVVGITVGTHYYTAVYSGDGTYQGSTSTSVPVTAVAPPTGLGGTAVAGKGVFGGAAVTH